MKYNPDVHHRRFVWHSMSMQGPTYVCPELTGVHAGSPVQHAASKQNGLSVGACGTPRTIGVICRGVEQSRNEFVR